MTQLLAGASGYSFKEWKGPFYPETIRPEEMLAYYAARLATVEINNSFYAMPKPGVLAHWVEVTPASFRFAIKASKRITHDARLKADAAADSVAYLYKVLGNRVLVAVERLMGMLLVAISVQMLLDGVKAYLQAPTGM